MTPTERSASGEVTRILERARGRSREEVLGELAPVVYAELKRLAVAQLRDERPDHSLEPTALVNEAYLRLVGAHSPSWEDRRHFFRTAAQAMRRILIDHARARGRKKRGGGRVPVSLSQAKPPTWNEPEQLLALDEALRRLEVQDPRAAEIVQLRYFGGLSVQQTGEAMGVSARTVKREWAFARAWLHDALRD